MKLERLKELTGMTQLDEAGVDVLFDKKADEQNYNNSIDALAKQIVSMLRKAPGGAGDKARAAHYATSIKTDIIDKVNEYMKTLENKV